MPAPLFNDLTLHRGEGQGRMPIAGAPAGSYAYAITDENQGAVDVGLVGTYTEVVQTINVTTLSGIILRLRTMGSPDSTWRVQVSLGGLDAYTETISLGDPLVDWHVVEIACGKAVGAMVLAVTVALL